jgi:ribosomal protein S18 acetylase RimI-like enzyme
VGVTIRPLEITDLQACARLLADRHVQHRRRVPALPVAYADPAACRDEIASLHARASDAIVAVDGDDIAGYMVATHLEDSTWGSNRWIEPPGWAVADPEVVRDLWGFLARVWQQQDVTQFSAVVPTHDLAMGMWQRLGFGWQQAFGIRRTTDDRRLDADAPSPTVVIRPAREVDIPVLAELDHLMDLHLTRAPVVSLLTPITVEEAVRDWSESVTDEEFSPWVAERDGRVIGSAVGCPSTKSRMHSGMAGIPEAFMLASVSVMPDARGRGVGRTLGRRIIEVGQQRGYQWIVTDWRVTNIEASRAWEALGFEMSFLRLHRSVAR